MVRQGTANPLSGGSNPPAASKYYNILCRDGGIGRRIGLKIRWATFARVGSSPTPGTIILTYVGIAQLGRAPR